MRGWGVTRAPGLRDLAHVVSSIPTVGHNRQHTYPHHCGPYKLSTLSDRYTYTCHTQYLHNQVITNAWI